MNTTNNECDRYEFGSNSFRTQGILKACGVYVGLCVTMLIVVVSKVVSGASVKTTDILNLKAIVYFVCRRYASQKEKQILDYRNQECCHHSAKSNVDSRNELLEKTIETNVQNEASDTANIKSVKREALTGTVKDIAQSLNPQINQEPKETPQGLLNPKFDDFPKWYFHYRHASKKKQACMEADLHKLLNQHPRLASSLDQNGDLPIHHVLAQDHGILAPVPLEVVRIILLTNPDSIKVADRRGLLPIHIACRYGGHMSFNVVLFLVRLWPESLKQRGTLSKYKRDMLPIHIICEYGSLAAVKALSGSLALVKASTEEIPPSLMIPNGNGDLPLHIACKGYNVSFKLVKFLVKAYPDAVFKPNEHGDLPLHIVCSRKSTITVIKLLVEHAPKTMKAVNNKGELPLHCVCNGYQSLDIVKFLVSAFNHSVRSVDYKNMLPIHHALSNKMPAMETVKYLVKQYPHSVRLRTKDGYLPLHQACRFGSVEAIKYLISICPEAVRDCENDKNILPLQLYCRNKHPSPAVVKTLSKPFPESVRTLSETTRVSLGLFRSESESFNKHFCRKEIRNLSI